MPRVHFVKKAQKDHGNIKKGESYYWWKFRRGGRHVSRTPPRASQLTQSDKLSRIYAAQEAVEDVGMPDASSYDSPDELADAMDEVAAAIREGADELRSVGEEYEESASNMEEYFQGSSQVDEIREKGEQVTSDADEWDTKADEWESAADDVRALDGPQEEELDEDEEPDPDFDPHAEWRSEAESILSNLDTDVEVNV